MATLDNFFVTISVFSLAIIFIVGLVMWNAVDIDAVFNQNDETKSIRGNANGFYDNLDVLFVLAFFGLHLGILILVFALKSHPIVYVAGIILIVLLAVVSAPLSNAYEQLASTDALTTADSSLSITHYLITNLPMIEVVFGFITLIILAGLARSENII